MDPVHDQHGGSSNNPITIKVHGVRSICIQDSTLLVMSKSANLSYYKVVVTTGNHGDASDCVVFKFNESEAAVKYHSLISVDHQCVVEALGHGKGLGALDKFSFLALRPFKSTFKEYTVKGGIGVDRYGRFTKDFIKLICDIVEAIEELHRLGYYCPNLQGDDIAVFKHADSVTAKLWNFCKCDSEDKKQKEGDWPRLGCMILSAASHRGEAADLYTRITSGELYGRSILKHSALLTVRKKFDNVLDLYFYVSINHPDVLPVTDSKAEVSDLSIANLMNDLDRTLPWNMPVCVTSKCSIPSRRTLRSFIKQLRIVVQHEVQYIPEEMTRKLHFKEVEKGKREMDLERHIQQSCAELFWAIHRLAAELKN